MKSRNLPEIYIYGLKRILNIDKIGFYLYECVYSSNFILIGLFIKIFNVAALKKTIWQTYCALIHLILLFEPHSIRIENEIF